MSFSARAPEEAPLLSSGLPPSGALRALYLLSTLSARILVSFARLTTFTARLARSIFLPPSLSVLYPPALPSLSPFVLYISNDGLRSREVPRVTRKTVTGSNLLSWQVLTNYGNGANGDLFRHIAENVREFSTRISAPVSSPPALPPITSG